MPTGYTSGIIDGKINTFPEFAKICMRAFGACIHLRDNGLMDKYEPRVPSNYYSDEIKEKELELKKIEKQTDKQFINEYKKELNNDKKDYLKYIEEKNINKKNLESILNDVNNWNPPTSDHTGVKKFMQQQINDTIENDCSLKYDEKLLNEIENKLNNIDVKIIRKQKIDKINEDIEYNKKRLKEEIDRCNESNKWVDDFLNSLPK